jgi:hypothetical protein
MDVTTLYVKNEDGSIKYGDNGKPVLTDEAKAMYQVDENGGLVVDAEDNPLPLAAADASPAVAQSPASTVAEQADPAAVAAQNQADADALSDAKATQANKAVGAGFDQSLASDQLDAQGNGQPGDAGVTGAHSTTGDGLNEAGLGEPLPSKVAGVTLGVDGYSPVNAASGVAQGKVTPQQMADANAQIGGTGGTVLKANDSQAESAHGVLSEIEAMASHFGGEVMNEIRNLAAKAKAFIDDGKAKVEADEAVAKEDEQALTDSKSAL